jgi:hypothetical protein
MCHNAEFKLLDHQGRRVTLGTLLLPCKEESTHNEELYQLFCGT